MSSIDNYHNLNLGHSPIILHIPQNTLIVRPTQPLGSKTPRILNPVPHEHIEKFTTKFWEENANQINNVTSILKNEQLTNN